VDEGPRSVSEAAQADSREQEQASASAAGRGRESKYRGVGGLAGRARASAATRVAWASGLPGAGGAAGRERVRASTVVLAGMRMRAVRARLAGGQ
jgi:hypothetical protein